MATLELNFGHCRKATHPKFLQIIDSLNNFNHINMKANDSLRIKALIDLEPLSFKSRGSPKVEPLFQSIHKKTQSESSVSIILKHTRGLFSTINSTNKQSNLKTDRLPIKTLSSVQTRNHTRQNS
jgi:hypothetical protein